jgi:hypothetical protein
MKTGIRHAWYYYLPAWLYLCFLATLSPWWVRINENILALVVQVFALAALFFVWLPVRQNRITSNQANWLLAPVWAFLIWTVLIID